MVHLFLEKHCLTPWSFWILPSANLLPQPTLALNQNQTRAPCEAGALVLALPTMFWMKKKINGIDEKSSKINGTILKWKINRSSKLLEFLSAIFHHLFQVTFSFFLPNNNVFIEETGNGRLLLLSNDSIIWEFTNRLDDDYLYVLNWSRYIDEESIPKMFKKIWLLIEIKYTI